MARLTRGGAQLHVGLLVGCLLVALTARVMPQRYRESVASALRHSVAAPFGAIEASAANVRSAVDSRDAVLHARGRGVLDTLRLRDVRDENLTLRGLLGLSARLRDGFVVAEVLPRLGFADDHRLTLAVGRDGGVAPFAPIVNADGLVGMVEQVDATTAYAITWAHEDFRVSAMSADGRAFGIVQPHLGTGGARLLLELRGVPFRAKLDSGALIVSSGLGPTYPRWIPVGTVVSEIVTAERWARTYLLVPAVLPDAIGPVLVLRPDRLARGVQGVWANAASADSAARAVAASGDSVARRAALDEVAARRAALDSAVPVGPVVPPVAPPVVPPTPPGRP